jgi:4-diphosphocytidyl-2-C-methyl-D-erythritol kinase
LAERPNDLEAPAIAVAPIIADVLAQLRALPGCRLARMSGSGATCFALFDSPADAGAAAALLVPARPAWWVSPVVLGAADTDADDRSL